MPERKPAPCAPTTSRVARSLAARELARLVGADLVEKLVFAATTVTEPIERASIAKHKRRTIVGKRRGLELDLDTIDGALRCACGARVREAGKATAEEDRRGLGKHAHVTAETLTRELEDRGLARAGSAGDDDEPWCTVLTTTAARRAASAICV